MEYNEDEFDPINKSFCLDLNPLIASGKDYQFEDLPKYVSYSTSKNYKEFELIKNSYERNKTPASIWKVIIRQHYYEILICFFVSIFDIFLTFVPSFLLNSLINYLVDPTVDLQYGLTICILLFTIPTLQSILRNSFKRFMQKFGLRVRKFQLILD